MAAAEIMPGNKDEQVLSFATRDNRILLTFDRDYGELIYRQGKPAPLGVVHLRFVPADPNQPADVVLGLNQVEGLRLEGRYTVVDPPRIRQRPLPWSAVP